MRIDLTDIGLDIFTWLIGMGSTVLCCVNPVSPERFPFHLIFLITCFYLHLDERVNRKLSHLSDCKEQMQSPTQMESL